MAEYQNLLAEYRCIWYSGNSQHLKSIKSRSEDLTQKKWIVQLPILIPPFIFTSKWNCLFQVHKMPSRTWLKTKKCHRNLRYLPEEQKQRRRAIFTPHTFPGVGRIIKVLGLCVLHRRSSKQAVDKITGSVLPCYLQLSWKTWFSGTTDFLSVRKSSKQQQKALFYNNT